MLACYHKQYKIAEFLISKSENIKHKYKQFISAVDYYKLKT